MRNLMLAPVAMTLMMSMLAAFPLASAQETAPDEKPIAYGDDSCIDCSGPAQPMAYGNDSCIDCSGPGEPMAYGNDSCIECMGPPETCMDGAQGNETCDDDVQYMYDPVRGPADGSCEHCRGDEVGEDSASHEAPDRDAPGLAAASVLVGLALVAGFARRK